MKDGTYQYYAGNRMYKNDKSLNYLLFDEGLVTKTSSVYSYEYHLKDHLGNTRITFQPNGSTTTTTQVAEYYPFGSSYLPISPAGTNKYLYNGKEKQDDVLSGTALDWYDYGARMYDPTIGRWHTVDPLIEAHQDYTPYAYVFNNPIKLIDPFGLDSTYYSATGTILYQTTWDKGKTSNNYVTKTTQSTNEMYSENNETDPEKGNSNSITSVAAQATEDQIKNGNLSGDLMKNVVKLNNTATMDAMVNIVSKDDGSGGTSANNNREYIGKISNGKVIEEPPGQPQDPSAQHLATSTTTAASNETSFHSHPSGRNGKWGWGKPPSKTDINTSTGRISYVFSMRQGCQTIYVYNKTGVIATIPIGVFKK